VKGSSAGATGRTELIWAYDRCHRIASRFDGIPTYVEKFLIDVVVEKGADNLLDSGRL
jgi:hypothetical protein